MSVSDTAGNAAPLLPNSSTVTPTPCKSAHAERPGYLNKNEIAAYFRVEPRTVDNWMKTWLPYRKLGGAVRFKLDEVEAAAELCRVSRRSLPTKGGAR